MRIISGQWRGRKLTVPDTLQTRPTMDRTREAVFGILRSRGVVVGARVLDVFAGSGAYGFEALSQGAAQVTFFEQDAVALAALRANITHLQCTAQAHIVSGDVRHAARNDGAAADVAFLDPPYHQGLLAPTLQRLAEQGWITPETLLVIEMEKEESLPAGLESIDTRRYGVSKIEICKLI